MMMMMMMMVMVMVMVMVMMMRATSMMMTQAMPVTTVTVTVAIVIVKVKTTALTMISMIIRIEARFFFFPKPHDERDLFLSFSIYSMAFRCLQDDHLPCYILVHFVQAKLRVSAVSDHAQVSIGCRFIRTVLRGRTLQMARNNTFCIHCLPWTSRRAYSKIEL